MSGMDVTEAKQGSIKNLVGKFDENLLIQRPCLAVLTGFGLGSDAQGISTT